MVVADRDPGVVGHDEGPVVASLHVELDVVHPEREGRLEGVEGVLQVPVLPGAEPVCADQHRVAAPAHLHDRYAAAARTSPASRPTSAAVSGCHCTARQNRSPPATSIASRVPSAACADATKPGCSLTL